MVAGAALATISIATYGVTTSLPVLIALRLVTGIGEGLFYTGSATIVTDIAPVGRVGEAISLYSVSVWVGTGVGPVIGQLVFHTFGASVAFLVAAALSLVATGLSAALPNQRSVLLAGEDRPALVHRAALGPGTAVALGVAGTVAFNAYVPLYSSTIHLSNPQYVFLLYSLVVVAVRVVFASLPDRWGPHKTGSWAAFSMGVGFALIAAVPSPIGLYTGTAVLAFGNSFIFPALLAMAVNNAKPNDRSPIVSTFSAFFDIANGVGGLALGQLAAVGNYRASFVGAAAFEVLALALLQSRWLKREKPSRSRLTDLLAKPVPTSRAATTGDHH
jgi:MFS family permease